jgi:DNA mismatch endonuclease, patch repair protein
MDHISKDHRSWNMSRIRAKDTKPELIVRKYLYSKGIRYRLHAKLPGKPDIVIKQRHVVIFVNGCFGHGHARCQYFRLPKTRKYYWGAKIGANIERDSRNYALLNDAGWRVLVIWECDIKNNHDKALQRLYVDIMT